MPMTSSTASASTETTAAKLRVLLTYRGDIDTKGGAAYVMERTAKALRTVGVDAELSYETTPAVEGFDLVHAFNIWSPGLALTQLRHLRATGVPVVWQPFYLHWTETAWAGLAVRAVLGQSDPAVRAHLIEELRAGRVVVNGMTRHGPNEIVPGFDAALCEMLDCVDHICVTSHHEIQTLSQVTRLISKPHTVVRHGVDAEIFAHADAEEFVSFAGVRDFALCVGAIDARKNQALLAEALRDSDLPLVLVGPAFEPDYRELVLARGGERLMHFERLPQELIASAYKAAAVHVLPSFAEASALANLEAAAAGCPLVVSNRSSEFEYYGDRVSYCDPSDPVSIRDAVSAALERAHREPHGGAELARHVAQYTWTRAAEQTLAAYRRTLAQAGKALVPDSRAFLTIAFAEELLAAPERLGAYAEAFDGNDDATLLILVEPDGERIVERLSETLAAAGLDDDNTVDMIASVVPARDWTALAARANALFSHRPAPPSLKTLPRFDTDTADALHRAAVAERVPLTV
jgi:glycosyltransferase involved in cell wall biosynthesis